MTQAGDFSDPVLLDELTVLISQAAAAILRLRDNLQTREKSDHSPVTAADEAAEAILLQGLSRLLPGITVISEESGAETRPKSIDGPFILVDPLDGTKEIVAGRSEFTVNVAIIMNHRPIVGLISAPVLGAVWWGAAGLGAGRLHLTPGGQISDARDRMTIQTGRGGRGPRRAVVSRSHGDSQTEAWLAQYPGIERIPCGSSLKFCRIAEGAADVYPRLGPVSEWDAAAGDALLSAAGGVVLTPNGEPLAYGGADHDFQIPAFVAWGNPAAARG